MALADAFYGQFHSVNRAFFFYHSQSEVGAGFFKLALGREKIKMAESSALGRE
jgi:hypothetical protein